MRVSLSVSLYMSVCDSLCMSLCDNLYSVYISPLLCAHVCMPMSLCAHLYGVYISPLLCAHVCMSMSLCAFLRFVQRCAHHQVAHDAHHIKALKMKMQTPVHKDQMCIAHDLMMHCVHLELNMHTPISSGLATVTSID